LCGEFVDDSQLVGECFVHVEVNQIANMPQHAQLGSMSQTSMGSHTHCVASKVAINLANKKGSGGSHRACSMQRIC
jgi:hypothetical protein